jgi:hypothetical protein
VLGNESRQKNNGRGNISHTPGDEIDKKAKGDETYDRYDGTKITLSVDNESAMRKCQTIDHREDAELLNAANFDLWIAIREEKSYWSKKFHVVTINRHEVDAACKKGKEFAHEKNSGVQEKNAATNCKLVFR